MAGIGFQLERMVRDGGIGGFVGASLDGAVLSSGPWIVTISGVLLLQGWLEKHSPGSSEAILTVMIYAFSVSVVISSPLALVGVRLASARIFEGDDAAIPGILILTLTGATIAALVAGNVVFGMISNHPASLTLFATTILMLLTQISVAGPFLTAAKRMWPVLLSYFAGVAATGLVVVFLPIRDEVEILGAIALGMATTLIALMGVLAETFPKAADPKLGLRRMLMPSLHVGLAGFLNGAALWADKWLLWFAVDSVRVADGLRINPIYDLASFVGLLTIIPGLSLMLVLSETRLERNFVNLVHVCTGTARLERINQERHEVVGGILQDLRLLIVTQTVLCTLCWVLAPEIFRWLHFDARGIFAFRFTVLGVIFHVLAIYACVVLSYFDLFGRIGLVWAAFLIGSICATVLVWNAGFAGYGLGYLTGAAAGAIVGLVAMAAASTDIVYLLFVGNNPSIVGEARYLV